MIKINYIIIYKCLDGVLDQSFSLGRRFLSHGDGKSTGAIPAK